MLKQPKYPYKAWVVYRVFSEPTYREVSVTGSIGEYLEFTGERGGIDSVSGMTGKENVHIKRADAIARAMEMQEEIVKEREGAYDQAKSRLAELKQELKEAENA